MAKIIGIWNRKGGVGKTHGAFNIGACMALEGKKVLLVDGDTQVNLTYKMFGNEPALYGEDGTEYKEENFPTIVDVISGNATASEAAVTGIFQAKRKTFLKSFIHNVSCELDLIPGSIMMDFVDPESIDCLKKPLDEISENYDYIILDFPPSSNRYTDCFLAACDYILTPVIINEDESFRGYLDVRKLVQGAVDGGLNENLKILGMYYNKVQDYRPVYRESIKDAQNMKEDLSIFDTYIKYDEKMRDSSYYQFLPLCVDAPRRNISENYRSLTKEIMEKLS